MRGSLARVAASQARDRRAKPTVHENGFIQLKLTPHSRLHVWPDGPIVRQRTSSPLHDHRFAFESTVITGHLIHVTYDLIECPRESAVYQVHVAPVPGGLHPLEVFGYAIKTGQYEMEEGSTYWFKERRFHETKAIGLTATVIQKTDESDLMPRVLCPVNEPPDNEFDRVFANPEDLLWAYIDRALGAAGLGVRDFDWQALQRLRKES